MPRKKKKNKEDNLEEEIIIGYNSKKMDNPPKKKKKKKKEKVNVKRKSKTKTKKKKTKKKKGIFKKVLKILIKISIVLGIATGIILFLFVSPVFNISEITVSGAKEINESVYIAMTGIEVNDNIFEVNKVSGEDTIKKEPYVEDVEIKRIYPNKIEIAVTERKAIYIAEEDGKFYYLDKNGYVLESSFAAIDLLIIKGCSTRLENIEIGGRIDDKDLERFNDLIKIIDAIQNNEINAKLTSIDVSDNSNYILEFSEENKTIMLGNVSNLSAKMAWINLFMTDKKNEKRSCLFKFR